ncbi:glutamyl-tRNA(Gln) amidotransferase subunit A [Gottschalkia acidurici 9a]|uniref:Glutamyl-tRNA(Gln) amidotransferase subunit A n=1 Tax=Gottschalkia acidurici (strain ATCC 7906 / DSM 604 / BCRC 14475 / CIP 104303 / KCTC 5404 / NCIMB 10678 / 9a) TaxID=1128398 RepID=K0AVX8_GOTA9|nr:amidase family protein [Gottschalkia acidurici]AFS77394.1 glutamyl-tRNA(Gln) amidotransferase subunit A [Gottschalkia acidurici 9a]
MDTLMNSTIYNLKEKLMKREVSSVEIVKHYLSKIEVNNDRTKEFITINKQEAISNAKKSDMKIKNRENIGLLEGIPVSIKDNISVKGMKLTCGSKLLRNFISPYDATLVKRLKNQGAIIIGKTNMNEFDIPSHGSSARDISKYSINSSQTPLFIGSFTDGSIADASGYWFRPTYGLISRYGVVPYSNTLDYIMTKTKDVKDLGLVLDILSGYDELDSTSIKTEKIDYISLFSEDSLKKIENMKIGLPKEYFDSEIGNKKKEKVLNIVQNLEKLGAKIEEISLPYIEYSEQLCKIISSAEASSNLSRFDGIRYGTRTESYESIDDLIIKTRSEGLSNEVKKNILLGTYFLSSCNNNDYYDRAIKLKNMITKEIYNIFNKIDVIVCPGDNMNYTSLSGIPTISIPCGDVSMQITGDKFREKEILRIAYLCDKLFTKNFNS